MSGAASSGPGDAGLRARLLSRVRNVPDFPEAGVDYKDITPLLADAGAFAAAVAALAATVPDDIDVVAAVEARGFLLGAPVAIAVGAGLVPVRKAGKLPGPTVSGTYTLEYGDAEIEVHADAVGPGQRVVVLDDVLATGGTAAATCALVEGLGAEVVAVLFLLELSFLGGRSLLTGRDVRSLVVL